MTLVGSELVLLGSDAMRFVVHAHKLDHVEPLGNSHQIGGLGIIEAAAANVFVLGRCFVANEVRILLLAFFQDLRHALLTDNPVLGEQAFRAFFITHLKHAGASLSSYFPQSGPSKYSAMPCRAVQIPQITIP